MLTRYPDSKEVLNNDCRMAFVAGDRKQAKELFARIGDDPATSCWRAKNNEFQKARARAMAET